MNLIKKYKNIIILISILLVVLGSTSAIDFAKTIAKSVENYFTKQDYSNLKTQSQKYQSTLKSSSKESTNTNANANTKSIFSNTPKKSAEEIDKEIMNQTSQKKDIRFNEQRLKKQLDDKKIDQEEFDLDFKELDDF